jgi:hypothetical protein
MADSAEPTLFHDEVVAVNLELGRHTLVRGYRGRFGLPAEAFTRLFAVGDDAPIEIRGPHDLSALVAEVQSLAQAVAFVDLFTSAATHFLFPDSSNVIELTLRTADQADRSGAITPQTAAAWGLELASAREEADRFVVDRNLLVRRDRDLEVQRVSEVVERDGSYAKPTCTVVRRVAAGDVIFPVYE